jgi:hypothetical protein
MLGEVYEHDLFDKDNDTDGLSMQGARLKRVRSVKRVIRRLMKIVRMDIMMVKRVEGLVVLLGQESAILIMRLRIGKTQT